MAQLEEYTQGHGQDPAAALDEALAAYLEWERMAFLVKMSAETKRDADTILKWLVSQHAGATGIRWFLALEDATASLASIPERCPLAPENASFRFGVSPVLVRPQTAWVSTSVHH